MLDWKPRGDAWSRRSASDEYAEDPVRAAPSHVGRLVRRMGLQHRFLSTEMLEAGVLQRDGLRVLMLPNAIALSPAAAAAIRRFVVEGGTAIADSLPGAFDQHSRRLPAPLLDDLFGPAAPDRLYGKGRAVRLAGAPGSQPLAAVAPLVERAGVRPEIAVRRPSGEPASDVEVSIFRRGAATIVAVQRARAAEGGGPAVLHLPRPTHVSDLITGEPLGERDRLELTLDAVVPSLLALSPSAPTPPRVDGASRFKQGDTATLEIEAMGDVLRVEARDPSGAPVPHYSGNLPAPGGKATWHLPFALNDATGTWTVRVTDLTSGRSARHEIVVMEP